MGLIVQPIVGSASDRTWNRFGRRLPYLLIGAAAAIIQQNLDKTHAVNDVTSIVFDFRGYDTMGEAFILITAVAGSMVILFTHKEKKKEDGKDEK